MAVNFSGFDELMNDLKNLGNVGNKIGRQAVQEGAQIVLKQQKSDAPRDANSNNHGSDELNIAKIKKYAKSGTVVARIGITSENWEKVKGLYFNHYGFEHHISGKFVAPHVGWMNDSFKKCKEKAAKTMLDIASSEIDKILK